MAGYPAEPPSKLIAFFGGRNIFVSSFYFLRECHSPRQSASALGLDFCRSVLSSADHHLRGKSLGPGEATPAAQGSVLLHPRRLHSDEQQQPGEVFDQPLWALYQHNAPVSVPGQQPGPQSVLRPDWSFPGNFPQPGEPRANTAALTPACHSAYYVQRPCTSSASSSVAANSRVSAMSNLCQATETSGRGAQMEGVGDLESRGRGGRRTAATALGLQPPACRASAWGP